MAEGQLFYMQKVPGSNPWTLQFKKEAQAVGQLPETSEVWLHVRVENTGLASNVQTTRTVFPLFILCSSFAFKNTNKS